MIAFAPPFDSLVRVSTDQGVTAPLTAEELTTSGSVTLDSEVEPMVSVNQSNRSNVVGMWQEDRWTTGGARNLVLGTSFDGGRTWTNSAVQGVTILAGGEFQRSRRTGHSDRTCSPRGSSSAAFEAGGGTGRPPRV